MWWLTIKNNVVEIKLMYYVSASRTISTTLKSSILRDVSFEKILRITCTYVEQTLTQQQ